MLETNVVSVDPLGTTDKLIATADVDGIPVCPAEVSAPSTISRELPHDTLVKHRLLQPDDVNRICDQERHADKNGLVTGLVTPRSVSVLIGDSGIGKSPLAYQLGLCIAAGVPFLGMKTQQNLVVYADYENPIEESRELRDQLVRFLELPTAPDNFLLWTPDFGDPLDIEGICRDVKPATFIIDSLRSHNPHFEKPENAGEEMKRLNTIARTYGAAIVAIHHVRKPGEDGVPLLDSEETGLMLWLKQAAGQFDHQSVTHANSGGLA